MTFGIGHQRAGRGISPTLRECACRDEGRPSGGEGPVNRKAAVLATLLLCPAALAVSPTAAAAPAVPVDDQQVIAQQNRELDPQALDVDPSTGQSRFTPLP